MRFIAALFVFAISASAQAPNVQTFGMVGLAEGQTARLNVLNVGGAGTTQCTVSLIFVDDQGATLKTNTFTVLPARSASLDLDADTDLELATNQRRQIRAVIAPVPVVPTPGQSAPTCVLTPTLEIFERFSGKTSIVMVNTTPIPQTPTPSTQP